MKYFSYTTAVAIVTVALGGVTFVVPVFATTCHSTAGGYCVALNAVAAPKTFAATVTSIPGLDIFGNIGTPGELVSKLYAFGISIVGISAMIMITYGGILYLTAGDSKDRLGKAKTAIGNAIFGLVLAFLSYIILNTINPALVQSLPNLGLTKISDRPLPTDSSGRPLGSPGSSVQISKPGEAPNPDLLKSCPTSCSIIRAVDGTTNCDCSGGGGAF